MQKTRDKKQKATQRRGCFPMSNCGNATRKSNVNSVQLSLWSSSYQSSTSSSYESSLATMTETEEVATEAQPKTSTENNFTNDEVPQSDGGDNNRDDQSLPSPTANSTDSNPGNAKKM